MSAIAFVLLAIVYLLIVSMLFIYGINFLYLSYKAIAQGDRSQASNEAPRVWPAVTVQLPVYNERYVAERLIKATANLDYPDGKLDIQVLDDSTDDTVQIVAAQVAELQRKGICIEHIHRPAREGYKAGALKHGFATARGDYLAIFDADFIPTREFLKRTIPHFENDTIAFVQARWDHINRDSSLLTHLQSLAIDAHFAIEQFARHAAGYWFNFNGTAGVWRRAAIEDAGGWTADTLTEDLDLSYRVFLKGWEARYVGDIAVPAELPVTMNGFRRQQHRWARGSLECAIKLLPGVWASTAPIWKKLQSSLHLTGYLVHVLIFGLSLLYPVVILLSQQFPQLISLFGITLFFNMTTFAPLFFFLSAQRALGRKWVPLIPSFALVSVAGMGMMINTVRAALQLIQGKSFPFERTPKFGVLRNSQAWTSSDYKLNLDPIIYYELGFALFNLNTVIMGLYFGNLLIALYAALYSAGLFFTAGYTLSQMRHVRQGKTRQGLVLEEQ